MNFDAPFWEHALTGGILLSGAVNDLLSRKIRNKLIVILIPLALAGVFSLKGIGGLPAALAGSATAFVLLLPLYALKAIGGGDVKLLMAAGLTLSARGVVLSFFFALPWALLMGTVKMILDGKLRGFALNLFSLARLKKPEPKSLHAVPFSIALIFGWLTYILTLKNLTFF